LSWPSTPSFVEAAGDCLGVKVIVVFSTLIAYSKPTASVSASRGLRR
jgi:hypothetical protein